MVARSAPDQRVFASSVWARARGHSALYDFGEVGGVLRPAEYDDGLNHRERVLGPMVDLLHEKAQAGFRLLALGQVRSHADDQPPAAPVTSDRRRPEGPCECLAIGRVDHVLPFVERTVQFIEPVDIGWRHMTLLISAPVPFGDRGDFLG